ncbi:MAG TPA: HesA/MoeB/ThiF family protein [Candidatus Dormibacteraeota bacterium]|nr:HesA/MoeB/ThiF family protein [Candidatus Dormibacteraeota bacterium]
MTDARHHRQRILTEVGEAGQRRLEGAAVAIVGVGGLGAPVALYLAAAGVGRLGLVDDQDVELSNLNRQIIFDECDVGRPKVEAAAGRLLQLDAALQVDPRRENIRASNVAELFAEYDLVVDATDVFETKFLLNDASVLLRKPLVHGAVLRWGGQVTTILPDAPCLRCLFREPPEPGDVQTCEEAGIIGAATGVVGSVQAEETLKVVLGVGNSLSGRIFQHDGLLGETRTTRFPRDPDCPVCSSRARITDLARYEEQVSPRGHVLV